MLGNQNSICERAGQGPARFLRAGGSTHVQDVASAPFLPLEHRLHRLLRGSLRQLDAVLLRPVHDGAAQGKVGGELQVSQPHAGDGARLVPLRQPPLDAVPVIGVAGGQDDGIHLQMQVEVRRIGG